jgi:predicted nucleic acid-binding Zn ribbon protein
MISQTAFQFKGEGWYVTDYGRKNSVSEKVEKELSSPEPATKNDDGAKTKKSPAKKTGSDQS